MADGGGRGKLAFAIVAFLAAGGIGVWHFTRPVEKPTVEAPRVCSHCGYEAALPFEPVSPDCPKCAEGQMVQRMFFKCAKCGTVFEACHKNWSSLKPRAAQARAQADAVEPRASEHDDLQFLLRRPGGKWAWSGSQSGRATLAELECPRCGPGPRKQFVKQLKGGADAAAR